jgi:hypothetical protein
MEFTLHLPLPFLRHKLEIKPSQLTGQNTSSGKHFCFTCGRFWVQFSFHRLSYMMLLPAPTDKYRDTKATCLRAGHHYFLPHPLKVFLSLSDLVYLLTVGVEDFVLRSITLSDTKTHTHFIRIPLDGGSVRHRDL